VVGLGVWFIVSVFYWGGVSQALEKFFVKNPRNLHTSFSTLFLLPS
jgi:hypothetical protein